jgi:hypothetical protein
MRLTESQLTELKQRRAPKRPKYHAQRWQVDGLFFHSRLEGQYYERLKLEKIAGLLRPPFFLRQVRFDLPGNTKYYVDFVRFPVAGGISFIDVKGYDTPLAALKIKQVEALYEIKIELWRG